MLYGSLRLTIRRAIVSAELFRRVLVVQVAESAGTDLAVLVVEQAHKNPRAVLFPYRYLEAARSYSEKNPDTPVFVTGVDSNTRPPGRFSYRFVLTDTEKDLYMAGQFAALLAGDKGILFSYDGSLSYGQREIFQNGLAEQGYTGIPVYQNAVADYSNFSAIGCVVVAGPAVKYLERNLEIPVILHTWADPGSTPGSVKIVLDDSPWALVTDILKRVPSEEEEYIFPSRAEVLGGRFAEKNDFRKIQETLKGKTEKK